MKIYNGDSFLECVITGGTHMNIAKAHIGFIRAFHDPISDKRDRVIVSMVGGGKDAYVFYFDEVTVPVTADVDALAAVLVGYVDATGGGAPTTTAAPTTTPAP